LPAEISDLFPDSFEDSELGEIPSGWSVRRLRDFIKPVKDRQGDRNIEEYSATVTGIEPRDSRFKKNLSSSGDKNKVALEGDLVFGLSRRTINFGRMAQPIGAFSSVYEVFRSISGSTISTKIVEQCIRSRISEFMVILKPAAREGQAIDREVLMDQLIADFPEQLSAKLETLLEPVSKRVELGSEHIFALEQLRNALLPKLISGEIRIPDAEKMLEEVGV
jgi:type I restriction enzyme S subunit